jgi:hypothetical protein
MPKRGDDEAGPTYGKRWSSGATTTAQLIVSQYPRSRITSSSQGREEKAEFWIRGIEDLAQGRVANGASAAACLPELDPLSASAIIAASRPGLGEPNQGLD